MTYQPVLSASSLDGDDVKNPQGEDLGSIKDIMIDTRDNSVAYYVLSFGGFMGMGDKYFALPPESITLDKENKCFILNADKERLKNAEGFDKDNWPNMADPSFRDSLYSYYGYEEKRRAA